MTVLISIADIGFEVAETFFGKPAPPNQFYNRFQTGIADLVFGLRSKQVTSGITP
jgi:hypothetical protein